MDVTKAKQQLSHSEAAIAKARDTEDAIVDRIEFLRVEIKGLRLPAVVGGEKDAQAKLANSKAELAEREGELHALRDQIPELDAAVERDQGKVREAEADQLCAEREGLERKALKLWGAVWMLREQASEKEQAITDLYSRLNELDRKLRSRGRSMPDFRLPLASDARKQEWAAERLKQLGG